MQIKRKEKKLTECGEPGRGGGSGDLLTPHVGQPAGRQALAPAAHSHKRAVHFHQHVTSLRRQHHTLLTSTGAPHVGQAPQAVRVAVTIAPEHLIGSRDHGPRARIRAAFSAARGGMSAARLSPRPARCPLPPPRALPAPALPSPLLN